jgi:type II secretory pathway component GspD/PulD (secretin)
MDLMAAAGAGGALPLPVAAAPVAASTPATIQDMITKRIRPDSWLPGKGTSIEERAGKLVVVQRPEVHRMISSLLTDLRQTQKIMVIVEGRLLTVREGLFEDLGVDWGTMGAPSIPTGTPGLRYTKHRLDPVNITTASLINNNVRSSPDTTSLGSFIMGSSAKPGFSGEFNFSHATLPGLQLMAVTHALRMKENGTELQAPKLIIHNGQRAHMWVGTQQAYTAGSTASGDTVMPTVNQLLLGVVFDVRPTVSADRRYITLEMRPTWTSGGIHTVYNIVSSVTGTTATGIQPIATTSLVQTDLPDIMMTRVRTSVAIPDGGIILLGGRMRDVQWDAEAGLPVVKNVPFLGRFFRWNRKDNERENLAILVTARTLLFDEEEKKQL